MRHSLKLKVGLALGGGAARGLAHIGVLRALERAKIQIDLVVGTSMGAILGGAYAISRDVEAVERQVRGILTSEQFKKNRLSFLKETKQERGGLFFSVANLVRKGIFFGVSNIRSSFVSAEEFANSMEGVLPETPIEKLSLPFGAVSLDLGAAEQVLIRHGSVRQAAAASSAIPGVLPPVELDGRVLIDGGWADKLPVVPAFVMGADVVIAVDISAEVAQVKSYRRGVDIMVRANSIKDAALVSFSRGMADLVIQPAVKDVHWANFGDFERCISAGDEAATRMVPAIRELLRHERVFSLVRPGRGKRHAELHMHASGVKLTVV